MEIFNNLRWFYNLYCPQPTNQSKIVRFYKGKSFWFGWQLFHGHEATRTGGMTDEISRWGWRKYILQFWPVSLANGPPPLTRCVAPAHQASLLISENLKWKIDIDIPLFYLICSVANTLTNQTKNILPRIFLLYA